MLMHNDNSVGLVILTCCAFLYYRDICHNKFVSIHKTLYVYTHKEHSSHDVASGSDLTSYNKIDKSLLLHKKPYRMLLTAMFSTHFVNVL